LESAASQEGKNGVLRLGTRCYYSKYFNLVPFAAATGALFPRAEELMNNEGVNAHGRARSLNFWESDCARFYLLRPFVLSASRGCHILPELCFVKATQYFAHAAAISLNLSSGRPLVKVQRFLRLRAANRVLRIDSLPVLKVFNNQAVETH
jgi:hypothetical protein